MGLGGRSRTTYDAVWHCMPNSVRVHLMFPCLEVGDIRLGPPLAHPWLMFSPRLYNLADSVGWLVVFSVGCVAWQLVLHIPGLH